MQALPKEDSEHSYEDDYALTHFKENHPHVVINGYPAWFWTQFPDEKDRAGRLQDLQGGAVLTPASSKPRPTPGSSPRPRATSSNGDAAGDARKVDNAANTELALSLRKAANVVGSAEQAMTCPVCLHLPKGEVYSCPRCHGLICGECNVDVGSSCPVCRVDFGGAGKPVRNVLAERMVAAFREEKE